MAERAHGIELSEGDRFAGYRIERRFGRGGMGVLYLAVEPGLERRVALKLIAPEAAADEVFARRFAEESKVAASIEHPNVVPIYAAGEEEGVPYIAMRYVAGADLARRLAREGRLSPALAVELIAQIGNGLDAIHAAGLIHRDVKPANVLLSGEEGAEHAYITDFGVARNVATESGLTQTGRFVGTLDYVAPEQISGDPVDARADVYALGCLLFKLLTGEVPFPRDGEAARLFAHLNDPPPAPSLYVPEIPIVLGDVVIRAMSKSPDDRYPSAGDLGRAAQATLRGEAPEAPERMVATGEAATRTVETVAVGPPRRLNRRPAIVAGALAFVAVVAVAVLIVGGGGSSSEGKLSTKTLSRTELIERVDAICAKSQVTYLAARQDFPDGENTPSVPYAKVLSGISTRAVDRFNSLTPPESVAKPYGEYVAAQERVEAYDSRALEAAKAGDTAAYLEARERRDAEAEKRHKLSREVGLETCSS
jgi:hypothetical protein